MGVVTAIGVLVLFFVVAVWKANMEPSIEGNCLDRLKNERSMWVCSFESNFLLVSIILCDVAVKY